MPRQLLRHQSPPQRLLRQLLSQNGPEKLPIISVSRSQYAPSAIIFPLRCQNDKKTINPVIETVIQEEAPQPPTADTSFELPVVSPPAPPLNGAWSPVEYDYKDYAREVSMSVFDAENQIWTLQKLMFLSKNWIISCNYFHFHFHFFQVMTIHVLSLVKCKLFKLSSNGILPQMRNIYCCWKFNVGTYL